MTPPAAPPKPKSLMETPASLFETTKEAKKLAADGLGYEDAWVRLRVPLAWREWVRDIVLGKR